jgi:hypothetical protein
MRCILCGGVLIPKHDMNELTIIGFSCPICYIEWNISEHKEVDDWSVRHIRSLETAVKDLKLTLNKILSFMEAYSNGKL